MGQHTGAAGKKDLTNSEQSNAPSWRSPSPTHLLISPAACYDMTLQLEWLAMDDGRPAPAMVSYVVEAKPTVTKVIVIAGGVFSVVAAVVGILLWNTGGSGLSYLLPRVLGVALFAPLGLLLVSMLTSGSTSLPERLAGWENATIEFTPWPPQLGRTMTAVYRRRSVSARARNKLTGQVDVETELECEEWVRYTVGTDTRTETHDLVEIHTTAPATATADGIEAVFAVRIPADAGGPSMELDHNRIRWELKMRLGHPFGKRTAAKIDLPVHPVLDVAALAGDGGIDR